MTDNNKTDEYEGRFLLELIGDESVPENIRRECIEEYIDRLPPLSGCFKTRPGHVVIPGDQAQGATDE